MYRYVYTYIDTVSSSFIICVCTSFSASVAAPPTWAAAEVAPKTPAATPVAKSGVECSTTV